MKQAFKVVTCICATEKLKAWEQRYGNSPIYWSGRLQEMLMAIHKG